MGRILPIEDWSIPVIRSVLWDLDGVLVDTGQLHFNSWMEVIPQYGFPFTWEIFHTTFGMNNVGVVTQALGYDPGPARITEISDRKEAIFRASARGKLTLLPGVEGLLQSFKRAGLSQAVASSAPIENIEFLVDELGIRQFFTALVSAFEIPGRLSKPDPAVFIEAARQLGTVPAQCLVIEDALVGIEAARRAGMRCLAVATTHLLTALTGADVSVERLDHLAPDTLRKLLDAS